MSEWTAPETGWYQFGGDVPPGAAGHYLAEFASGPAGEGPPYVHTFDPGEPEAVITRLWRFLWDVNIEHGLTVSGKWLCFGKRHAESKARRELRKYKRVPYSYTITL